MLLQAQSPVAGAGRRWLVALQVAHLLPAVQVEQL
jgi:hypothetical protein